MHTIFPCQICLYKDPWQFSFSLNCDMDNEMLTEIPEEFYSASTGSLFDKCIECEKNLLEGDTEYLIEKAVKNYPGYKAKDVLFDYAICMECATKMHEKMSKESLATIQEYFENNIDFKSKMEAVESGDMDRLTQNCLIKNTPKSESAEFQLYAHCRGDKLFMGNPPYVICGEAMEEVMELLSKSTKDELGGFFNKHFSPDPDLFEKDPSRLILI